jgi:hypothetical protein
MSMDALFDEGAPADPLEYAEGSPGALFVPMTGLSFDRDCVRVGGFRLVRIGARAWREMEKNWLVDLYQEFYAANPRYYCVIPVESADGMIQDCDAFLRETTAPLEALLLALRLTAAGFVVDTSYSTPVLRLASMNYRAVGRERYRLYGLVFGGDVVLLPKARRLGDQAIVYPERILRSSGPALHVPDEAIAAAERTLASCREYAAGPPNPAVAIAIRNLTRGHDVFCTRRERLLCLTTALEVVFGGFGGAGRTRPLGRRIAEAYAVLRGDAAGIEDRVETEIRSVRNAIAHGADYRRDLDYESAEDGLRDLLRVGLPPLIRLATSEGADARALATEPGDDGAPTPPEALQRLIVRSADGDAAARQALGKLG